MTPPSRTNFRGRAESVRTSPIQTSGAVFVSFVAGALPPGSAIPAANRGALTRSRACGGARPLQLDAQEPERAADRAAGRLDVLAPHLGTGDRRLEPVLEPLPQR